MARQLLSGKGRRGISKKYVILMFKIAVGENRHVRKTLFSIYHG